jgi:hypothetical protein
MIAVLMPAPDPIKQMEFKATYLDPLETGDTALHVQSFPNAYPTDVEAHERLKRGEPLPKQYTESMAGYTNWVRSLCARGVILTRLRTLPARQTDDVPPMIELCQTVAEAGEHVKVTILEQQLGRLAAAGVPKSFEDDLRAQVPRAGLWSIRYNDADSGPAPIGVMHYRDDGSYRGVEVHHNPSPGLIAYEKFWRDVFGDDEQSVPLEDWRKLY